jgi:hypothetical protein
MIAASHQPAAIARVSVSSVRFAATTVIVASTVAAPAERIVVIRSRSQ